MPKDKCSIEGCFREAVCKGLCKNHYTSRLQYPKWRANNLARTNENARRSMKLWRGKPGNSEKARVGAKAWRRKLRIEVLSHYSDGMMACAVCGYSDIRALSIDHINHDGGVCRRKVYPQAPRGAGAYVYYQYIRKNQFPPGHQVLCLNCNCIKEKERIGCDA